MSNNIPFISILDIYAKFHAKNVSKKIHSFVITCNYSLIILLNILYLVSQIERYCLVWHSWVEYMKLFNMCSITCMISTNL